MLDSTEAFHQTEKSHFGRLSNKVKCKKKVEVIPLEHRRDLMLYVYLYKTE